MRRYVYFVRGEKHALLANTSIASVRRADPTAEVLVTTDEHPDGIAALAKDVQVYTTLHSGSPIMLANLEAQLAALYEAKQGDEIVFIDTDTIVLEPLPIHGELVVTWRNHVKVAEDGEKIKGVAGRMPYNYGVIGVLVNPQAIEAFQWLRDRIRVMHPQHQSWYGNQLALAELCGPPPPEVPGVAEEKRRIWWSLTMPGSELNIVKLPCERWNYTPPKVGEAIHGRRGILHFKGHSRGLMGAYARRLDLPWHEPEPEPTSQAA